MYGLYFCKSEVQHEGRRSTRQEIPLTHPHERRSDPIPHLRSPIVVSIAQEELGTSADDILELILIGRVRPALNNLDKCVEIAWRGKESRGSDEVEGKDEVGEKNGEFQGGCNKGGSVRPSRRRGRDALTLEGGDTGTKDVRGSEMKRFLKVKSESASGSSGRQRTGAYHGTSNISRRYPMIHRDRRKVLRPAVIPQFKNANVVLFPKCLDVFRHEGGIEEEWCDDEKSWSLRMGAGGVAVGWGEGRGGGVEREASEGGRRRCWCRGGSSCGAGGGVLLVEEAHASWNVAERHSSATRGWGGGGARGVVALDGRVDGEEGGRVEGVRAVLGASASSQLEEKASKSGLFRRARTKFPLAATGRVGVALVQSMPSGTACTSVRSGESRTGGPRAEPGIQISKNSDEGSFLLRSLLP